MYADEVDKDRRTFKKNFSSARGSGIDGKWKRDMFQTANRSPKQNFTTKRRAQTNFVTKAGAAAAGLATRNISTASIRGRTAPAVVREIHTGPSTLIIKNLATTVTQEDLEELFEQYEPELVQLHYGPTGESNGCADLIVPHAQVAIIQKALEGVLLDGEPIEVLEANPPKQVSVFDRIKKVSRGNDFKAKNMRVVVKSKGGFQKRGARGDF
ncbi:RRM domain-containing protein [Caenorhabditis elegans]|uniref:RRM domain-containing protein n=1 Tax=Caenorhabditis elegans TaxID=6239 RepID=O44444_CAEEL|nr:RRM domain-containing protein [Caenorhabditis elegans]CCD61166.1 RRM domain-containing protein [Caenorhabditis elegans]|eukprot:NP_500722.1 Uncharacterized protein CELE_C02B10.4 [Caenorhabditis elegans]